jgi:hypothetical protein
VRLYELAWEMGHSSGYHEVESYYDEMAELLTPNAPAPVTPAPCTLTQFRAVLIRHCVVGYDAIADGEHYDGGRTLKATAAALEEIRAMMGGQAV